MAEWQKLEVEHNRLPMHEPWYQECLWTSIFPIHSISDVLFVVHDRKAKHFTPPCETISKIRWKMCGEWERSVSFWRCAAGEAGERLGLKKDWHAWRRELWDRTGPIQAKRLIECEYSLAMLRRPISRCSLSLVCMEYVLTARTEFESKFKLIRFRNGWSEWCFQVPSITLIGWI